MNSPEKEKTDSQSMWGGRFDEAPAELMERFNASIGFDKRLAKEDIEGSLAHAAMLKAQGILSAEDEAQICSGLETIAGEIESGVFEFSERLEDIHMNIEARLKALIGDAGARLHTARSRNDQVATDIRLWMRKKLAHIETLIQGLQSAFLEHADVECATVMPGFTHLQAAQPITFGHYCLAYVEMLSRDAARFASAAERANECPLGAAALAGTSFPIDRHTTASALGFEQPCRNSLDAVSARDFALEALSAASICATHLSRFAEEVVVFSTPQFDFFQLPDQYSTGSSIMPQKRNPDAAELIRAKTGRVIAAYVSLSTVMKGLPLAYSKDMQEDKEQVFDSLDTLEICLKVATGFVQQLKINADKMRAAASVAHATATDVADWLVRELNIPFRDAHHITGRLVAEADANGLDIAELSPEVFRKHEPRITDELLQSLTAEHSAASRNSFGGTAPEQVRAQVNYWRTTLAQ